MKNTGITMLKTTNGERKMHYVMVEGVVYMATKASSNKINDIKANATVYLDEQTSGYEARILTEASEIEHANKTLKEGKNFLNNFFSKFNKADTYLVLTVKN